MISVLSLVVAILAVFFGPLVARANLQQQLQVTAREAWMREFREQVAALFSSFAVLRDHERTHNILDPVAQKLRAELNDAMLTPYHTIRLLIAEKGTQYAAFVPTMDRALEAVPLEAGVRVHELYVAAEDILRNERAAIASDPGVWIDGRLPIPDDLMVREFPA